MFCVKVSDKYQKCKYLKCKKKHVNTHDLKNSTVKMSDKKNKDSLDRITYLSAKYKYNSAKTPE